MTTVDSAPHVTVHVTQRFGASAYRVFDAWLDTTMVGKWLFATASRPMSRVEINARVGGEFCFEDEHDTDDAVIVGKFFEIIRPSRLVFTLSGANSRWQGTRVSVNIAPLQTGCELILAHEHVLQNDANLTEGRWYGMFYGLGLLLDERSQARHGATHISARAEKVGSAATCTDQH